MDVSKLEAKLFRTLMIKSTTVTLSYFNNMYLDNRGSLVLTQTVKGVVFPNTSALL